MKILLAVDSFKGSLNTIQVEEAIAEGILEGHPSAKILKIPMADGGEGTLDSVLSCMQGKRIDVEVLNPSGVPMIAEYAILEDGTALIEMAKASGLTLIPPDERNPLVATTFGIGQLILDALNKGCRQFYIGIGGSATNDGGAGMAQALGVKLLDEAGQDIGFGGIALKNIAKIDICCIDQRIFESDFKILCDVDNPLCGRRGATAIYGPQKGVKAHEISVLDAALEKYQKVLLETFGKDFGDIPGSGAAGGLGAGLMAFCKGHLLSGVDALLDLFNADHMMDGVDLVITGEGQIDYQTIHGKVPFGVAKVAKKHNIPVIAVVGNIGEGYESAFDFGIKSVFSIASGPMTLEESMTNAKMLLKQLSLNIIKLII